MFKTHLRRSLISSASPPFFDTSGGRDYLYGNALPQSGLAGAAYPIGSPQWLGLQGFYSRYFVVMSHISIAFTLQKPTDGQFLCTLSPVYSHGDIYEADQACELP